VGETRRRFDREFRAGAVRIVAETGKSVAQVARDLGISVYTLHNWVRAERRQADGEPAQDGAVTESERDELDQLRAEREQWAKEKTELEMERDVLIGLVGGRAGACGGRLVMC
jgi:transposase